MNKKENERWKTKRAINNKMMGRSGYPKKVAIQIHKDATVFVAER
jgi:hypothetical protein